MESLLHCFTTGCTVSERSSEFLEDGNKAKKEEEEEDAVHQGKQRLPGEVETEQERLIKLGQMTPFGSVLQEGSAQDETRRLTTPKVWTGKSALSTMAKLVSSSEVSVSLQQGGSRLPETESDEEYVPDVDELRKSWHEDKETLCGREGTKIRRVGSKKRKKVPLNVKYNEGDTTPSKKIKRPRDVLERKATDDGNERLYRQRIRSV